MTDPTTPGPEPAAPAHEPGSTPGAEPDAARPGAEPDAARPGAEPEAADAASPEHPWPSDVPAGAAPANSARRPTVVLGWLVALALGVVIGVAGFAISTGAIGSAAPSPTPGASAPPAGNTFGRPDAPVTIEVWADYQCPFCRLEDVLFGGAIDREYVTPGIARVVYRDFAFLGQESIDAAVASRCAGAQEPAAQLRYHDALYTFQQGENQGRYARENLVQLAEIAGVPSQDAFTACLDDPAVAQAVTDETMAGRNVGVTSTPTLRLRGPGGERVLTGFSRTWPPVREAIEAVRVAPAESPSPLGSPVPSASAAPSPMP
jgi:protein-disulfide isomerase